MRVLLFEKNVYAIEQVIDPVLVILSTALVPVRSFPRHLKVVLAHVVVVIVPPDEVQVPPAAMFTLDGIVTGDPTPCEAT